MKTVFQLRGRRRLLILPVLAAIAAESFFMQSCRRPDPLPSSAKAYTAKVEEFYADNDIAMVLRSIADAIKVGEPLDSAEYDFEGVLTDGEGSPLYTDVQGSPGLWEIDVLSPKKAVVRNVYLGDLLTADLQTYLLGELGLDSLSMMTFHVHDAEENEDTDVSLYDLGGGYLRFEVREAIAPNGLEGPLLNIILSADPPAGAGTHTNG